MTLSKTDVAIRARWRTHLLSYEVLLRAARARRDTKTANLRLAQVKRAREIIARHTPAAAVAPRGISRNGVDLIARFEGFRAMPYRDSVGVPTQGYGETRGVTMQSKAVTETQAKTQLRLRCDRDYAPPVLAACKGHFKPTQRELDALVSLCYNVGPGVFSAGHSMGDAVRSGSRSKIEAAFGAYVMAGGHRLQGLVNRRAAERQYFAG